MSPFRWVPAVAVSLLLLGLAGGLYRLHFPPGPVADEAGYLMLTQSLWHDGDLKYEHQDLQRAYQLWDQGPYGLILLTKDGGQTMYYGKPFIYPLVAVPFYAVFGPQGLMVLNMGLLLAMFWTAWRLFGARDEPRTGLLLAGFFFASASFGYVFWLHPEVFNGACLFFAFAAWHHARTRPDGDPKSLGLLAAAGMLVAMVFISKEALVLLGVPIGLDLLWSRRWRGAAACVAGLTLVALLCTAIQWRATGTWSPYRDAQRSSFDKSFPLEGHDDFWALYRGTSFGSWSGTRVESTPAVLARNVGYFVFGRHVGLLPYFPFALFLFALYLVGPKDRSRHLLLLAVAGYCLLIFLVRPYNFHGGAGFIGNRYFASIYPVLLFLPGRLRADRSLVLPFAAAGLWVAPVLATPVQQVAPEFGLQVHTRTAPFQLLPAELTLLAQGRVPGYFIRTLGNALWVVPKENFFAGEDGASGLWVRGGSRSEIFLVSPEPLGPIQLTVGSVSADNVVTFDTGEEEVVVRFDTAEKRIGTPIEIRPELLASNLKAFFTEKDQNEYFYRLVLTTTDGLLPARVDRKSKDERYLGVFLKLRDGEPQPAAPLTPPPDAPPGD